MYPPLTKRDGKVVADLDAPIKKWHQDSAYDSAKECEDMKVHFFVVTEGDKSKLETERGARCVPAEHIYPPLEAPQK